MDAMAERSLGGRIELDDPPSGMTWQLACPAANGLEGARERPRVGRAARRSRRPCGRCPGWRPLGVAWPDPRCGLARRQTTSLPAACPIGRRLSIAAELRGSAQCRQGEFLTAAAHSPHAITQNTHGTRSGSSERATLARSGSRTIAAAMVRTASRTSLPRSLLLGEPQRPTNLERATVVDYWRRVAMNVTALIGSTKLCDLAYRWSAPSSRRVR